MANIEKRYLEGLVFRDAVRKEVEEDGETRVVYVPTERPLEPADVLAVREDGSNIIFSTADGKKYTVAKSGKARE